MALHPSISSISAGIPLIGERTRVYLLPGELQVSDKPCQMTTILGSCVAVCLWDTKLHIGGMNHFLLPACTEGSGCSMRFGDLATRSLLQRLLELGSQRQHFQAKLFGGSALFRSEARYESSLGAKNVALAKAMMNNAGIPVIAEDTGGSQGRKIVFNTDDGSAWSRQV
jgi:chemotaxis protein CheD